MRIMFCLAGLLCLGGCGNEESPQEKAALVPEGKQTAYAECMAAADRQPSRAETVAAAQNCSRLAGAPPPDTALPPVPEASARHVDRESRDPQAGRFSPGHRMRGVI
jgi:hypothetical protein